MTIDQIKNLRAKLPDNWKWDKCYEMGYTSNGIEVIKKHWALSSLDGKGPVFSVGLISVDNDSTKKEFLSDYPVQFIEQSLTIIDTLLKEIERLKNEMDNKTYKNH